MQYEKYTDTHRKALSIHVLLLVCHVYKYKIIHEAVVRLTQCTCNSLSQNMILLPCQMPNQFYSSLFTGFIGKWLNKKVDALDEKSAKLEAEMEGKKILGKPKEEQVQGDTSGGGFDDDDGTGLESLGVLGAANLKMKMKRFSKIAHKNQAGNNTSGNVGSGGDDNGEYYNDESQYYEDQGNGDDGTYGEEGYYDENQNYYDTAEQQQGDDAYVDQQQQQQQYGGGDY